MTDTTFNTVRIPTTGIVLINWKRQSDSSRGNVTAKGDLQKNGQFATVRVWGETVKVLKAKAGHLYLKAVSTTGDFVNIRVENINTISA